MTCFGVGYFTSDPVIKEVKQGDKTVFVTTFNLKCPENEHKFEILKFEAWDSAAEYICNHAKAGDMIRFEAVPRQYYVKEKDTENKLYKTKFRMTGFTISIK